jgi:hypothetical protein
MKLEMNGSRNEGCCTWWVSNPKLITEVCYCLCVPWICELVNCADRILVCFTSTAELSNSPSHDILPMHHIEDSVPEAVQ